MRGKMENVMRGTEEEVRLILSCVPAWDASKEGAVVRDFPLPISME